MDFSAMYAQSSPFTNSTFAASTATTPTTAQGNFSINTPDKNKEKKFNDWHQKQGIPAPQDYSLFASQPAPFSSVQQNPNQPTAASPYLQKVLTQQAVNNLSNGSGRSGASDNLFSTDMPDGRRKPPLKRTSSTSPPTSGAWPKSMFGTRPPSRTRARTSSTPDLNADLANTEENAPPLASIYDTFHAASPPATTTGAASSDLKEAPMTPTQVRVANFSEDRFPDLIRALRRYYGPILEPYSGLPESESKFSDPGIVPRAKLDLKTTRMVQPMSGSDGGPGPWVRITFREREAAERAVNGASRGELVIAGRIVLISLWEKDPIVEPPQVPFMMDTENATAAAAGAIFPQMQRRPSRPTAAQMFEEPPSVAAADVKLSEHMPGARVLVPKQVEFAKREGWISGWTNALVGAGRTTTMTAAHTPVEQQGWTGSMGRSYRYVMDEVVGFKYL